MNGNELVAIQSLAGAVTTLTAAFGNLVDALDEDAAIAVDAAWAEAACGDEGGPTRRSGAICAFCGGAKSCGVAA